MLDIETAYFYSSGLYGNCTFNPETSRFFLAALPIFWKTSRFQFFQIFSFIFQNSFVVCFCFPVFHNRIICFIIMWQYKISDIDTPSFYFSRLYGTGTIDLETSRFFPGGLSDFLEDFQIVFNLCDFVFQFSKKNNLFQHIGHYTMMHMETS